MNIKNELRNDLKNLIIDLDWLSGDFDIEIRDFLDGRDMDGIEHDTERIDSLKDAKKILNKMIDNMRNVTKIIDQLKIPGAL